MLSNRTSLINEEAENAPLTMIPSNEPMSTTRQSEARRISYEKRGNVTVVSTKEQTEAWGAQADAWFNKYGPRLTRIESDDFKKIRGLLVKTKHSSHRSGHRISRVARESPTWVRLVMIRILFGDEFPAPNDSSFTASTYRKSWRNVNWDSWCPNGERLIGETWVSPLISLGGSQTRPIVKTEEPLAERNELCSGASTHTIIQSIEDEPEVAGIWDLKKRTASAALFNQTRPFNLTGMGHITTHKTFTSGSAIPSHAQPTTKPNLRTEADDASTTLSMSSVEANTHNFEMTYSEYARTTRVLALEERVMDLERALHSQRKLEAQILALTKELAHIKEQSATSSAIDRENSNLNNETQDLGPLRSTDGE